MNDQVKSYIDYINSAKQNLSIQKQFALELGCSKSTIEILDKLIVLVDKLESIAKNSSHRVNYLNQFRSNLENILGSMPLFGQNLDIINHQNDQWKAQTKEHFDNISKIHISNYYDQLLFNLIFFENIGFFNNNVVAIGANGSGKTTLSNKFKEYLHNNGVVISAQRILLVPSFDSIANPSKTASDLKQAQTRDKTNKTDREYNHIHQEFAVVLKNLLADNITAGNLYRKKSLELTTAGKQIEKPTLTNLDKTFQIWNSLIEHRIIDCTDGINIMAKSDNSNYYPVMQMSDGEKVMLYLIAQVLQAPEDGFIIVDEPEMYLHKTILKKLWDSIEKQRPDCLFIYLTHDLDFASSRTTAKKIWIKSFIYPDNWEIEDIPTDEIPEALLFELLGSRKNILFCEGEKGSIDERVYSIIFPELTVIPVGTCFNVINHTKAFNKLINVNTFAIGLIDSDHHGFDRLASLKSEKIYSYSVSEVENLFLDENFLHKMARQLLVDANEVNNIKDAIINELNDKKEIQAANYVSTKINYYFKDTHVSKGNNLHQIEENFNMFTQNIAISAWYSNRITELEEIVHNKDYKSTISIFNDKGLRQFAKKYLKISDFTERSIKLLLFDPEVQSIVRNYFPDEVKKAGYQH